VAVAFRTVDGRDEVMIDADEEFHAASTMKVPVMVELFRQAAAGTLSLDDRVTVVNEFRSVVDGSPYSLRVGDDSDADIYAAVGTPRTYRQLCEAMITVSSNLATNLLVTRLGAEAVQQTMGRYGAGGMRVRRGVEDGKAFRAGLNNTATARAYAAILAAIAKGETVSAAASAEMVEILKRQKFRAGIPAGLPPDVPVGNKTGTITRIHHDGAIVLGPRPYVLVVLTRGFADEKSSDALIARITGEIHATVH
jgi:beta-lactamase class A